MKKRITVIVSVILTLACICGIGVYASANAEPQVERVQVYQNKNYYAYYNDASLVGAVAFCLNNQFTRFGTTEEKIRLCTKNPDGTYTALYSIEKENVTVQFAGEQDYSLTAGDGLSALLGGIDGIGITFDRQKTNLAFSLIGQPIKRGTAYYVYIPSDYFLDAAGRGNVAAYLTIAPSTVNSYTGDVLEDLKNATSGIYDAIIFAAESINGALK